MLALRLLQTSLLFAGITAAQDEPALSATQRLLTHLSPPELESDWNMVLTDSSFRPAGEPGSRVPGVEPAAALAAIEAGRGGVQDYLAHGWQLLEERRQVEALDAFQRAFAEARRAISLAPEDPAPRLELASALSRFGRVLGAPRAMTDALELYEELWSEHPARRVESSRGALPVAHFLALSPLGDAELRTRARRWCERALEVDERAYFALFALQQLALYDLARSVQREAPDEVELYERIEARTAEFGGQAEGLEDAQLAEVTGQLGLSLFGVLVPVGHAALSHPPQEWCEVRARWTRATLSALDTHTSALASYPELAAAAAERSWQLALLLERDDEPARFALALERTGGGAALVELRLAFATRLLRPELVELATDQLLELRDDARTRAIIGTCLFRLGEWSAATAMYRAASKASPQEAAPWLGVGVSALCGGADPQLALAALQRAAELQPNHPQIATALAVALFLVGHAQDARALAERAAQLDPNDQNARAVCDLMRELAGSR